MDTEQLTDDFLALLRPAAVLLISFLVAFRLMERSAGLPNVWPQYLAIIIWCAGVAIFLVWTQGRSQTVKLAASFLGVLIALGGVADLANISLSAKHDLMAANIGTRVQIADGVITCTRQNTQMSNHLPGQGEDLGWKLFYAYGVGGALYKQLDYTPTQYYRIGDPVKVLYKLDHPAVARLVRPGERLPDDAGVHAESSVQLPVPNPAYTAC